MAVSLISVQAPTRTMSGADDKAVHFATSIEYYAREGLFGHLQDECDRLREKRGDRDGAVLFWRAVALGMSTQVPAAMNALASLQGGNYRDYELASLVGQAHFNRAQVTYTHTHDAPHCLAGCTRCHHPVATSGAPRAYLGRTNAPYTHHSPRPLASPPRHRPRSAPSMALPRAWSTKSWPRRLNRP